MTYTEEAVNLVQIPPLDGAQYESILANNIQRSNEEERYAEEKTTRLCLRKNTPTHIYEKSVKNAKTQHQHNQATNT
jgi:hypothetical protein